jgi:hypothetical protein
MLPISNSPKSAASSGILIDMSFVDATAHQAHRGNDLGPAGDVHLAVMHRQRRLDIGERLAVQPEALGACAARLGSECAPSSARLNVGSCSAPIPVSTRARPMFSAVTTTDHAFFVRLTGCQLLEVEPVRQARVLQLTIVQWRRILAACVALGDYRQATGESYGARTILLVAELFHAASLHFS